MKDWREFEPGSTDWQSGTLPLYHHGSHHCARWHVCWQELYPLGFSKLSIFSWRAIASQLSMCPAKLDINIKCWLAIARDEKIDNLEKTNGYNSCDALSRATRRSIIWRSQMDIILAMPSSGCHAYHNCFQWVMLKFQCSAWSVLGLNPGRVISQKCLLFMTCAGVMYWLVVYCTTRAGHRKNYIHLASPNYRSSCGER